MGRYSGGVEEREKEGGRRRFGEGEWREERVAGGGGAVRWGYRGGSKESEAGAGSESRSTKSVQGGRVEVRKGCREGE